MEIISQAQIEQRKYWVEEIIKISGNFGSDSNKLQQEITNEIQNNGINSLVGHLRLCGAIPEQYGHDTSEEKLYSKYTDIVLSETFSALGINSLV
ncbi:MAG: HindIII family type II restriction endonuclease, partial [Kamptonema sp. SIO4C4]|nr:HindIII family type II restriction endonuclease [Kamptonema sp. SIO4C4]